MAKKKTEDQKEKAEKESSNLSKLNAHGLMALINSKIPGAIMTAQELYDNRLPDVPTGVLSLDRVMGGGFPRGLITHIYGRPSSGKSTSLIQTIGYNHQIDPEFFAVIVNIEGYWGPKSMRYVSQFGVDPKRLLVIHRPNHEESLAIAETVLFSNKVDLLGIDSVAGLVSADELEREMTENQARAEHARMVRRWLNRVIAKSAPQYDKEAKKTIFNKTAIAILNQITNSMDMYHPDTTTGGTAPNFYSSIEIKAEVTSVKDNIFYKEDKEAFEEMGNNIAAREFVEKNAIGQVTTYTCFKNRTAPTRFRKTKVPFYNMQIDVPSSTGFTGFGFDQVSDILDLGKLYGYIEEKGAWHYFNKEKYQGKQALIDFLRANKEYADELYRLVAEEVHNEFK